MPLNHPLRSLASSRLIFAACFVICTEILMQGALATVTLLEAKDADLFQAMSSSGFTAEEASYFIGVSQLAVILSVLENILLRALPLIGLFWLYRCAKKFVPFPPAAFSLLKGCLMVNTILYGFSVITGSFSVVAEFNFSTVADLLESVLLFATFRLAKKAVSAASELSATGRSAAGIPDTLPTLLAACACLNGGTFLLVLAANLAHISLDYYSLSTPLLFVLTALIYLLFTVEYLLFYFLTKKSMPLFVDSY